MNPRNLVRLVTFVLSASVGTAVPAHAQRPAQWFVPDVIGQFNALTQRADPIGFHIGESPDPSTCKHYQGLTRIEGPDGTPYLIVTRSGNTPSLPGPDPLPCDDSPGETGDGSFLVVRMGSRDMEGERFRSNRQTKGYSFDVTPPDPRDRVATWFRFQGGLGFPHYGHPGGMQAVGHMLALAVEHPNAAGLPETVVLFINMRDPINPEIRSSFPVAAQVGEKAGLVALTQLADNHYLMMVTGGSNAFLQFYRSNGTDLMSDTLTWTPLDSWLADSWSRGLADENYPCLDGSVRRHNVCYSPDEVYMGVNWPTTGSGNGNPHQTIQFIRQADINGTLFLAGTRGSILGDDYMDLYEVECDTALCLAGEEVRLVHKSTRHMISNPNAGGDRLANFAAASTFYVSPSGELLLYATEHDNDGPNGTVKAGEWRHRDMVRSDSPTLKSSLTVNSPFTIDEGSVGTVTANAKLPTTRAWMQLFTGQQYDGLSVVVDYDDYVLDDYNNLLAFQFPLFYLQHVRSWRWYAPLFCNAQAIANDDSGVPYVRTLAGAGVAFGNPDLALIKDDSNTIVMDKRATGVDFLDSCDAYYNTAFNVAWDRNNDGTYESVGSAIDFDATTIDGPASFTIPVSAAHPVGGSAMNATASVVVSNVAPVIAGFRVTNSAGRVIGVDMPFALVRTPVNVTAQFTDPGRADRQTAQVNWGDTVVESQTAFTSFTDAYNGAVGSLAHAHRYQASGQYTLALAVTDDDGGADLETVTLRVLTPAEAINEILPQLDAAIAAAPTAAIRNVLRDARTALMGREHAQDGALRKLAENQPLAASGFVVQAINWLQNAQALGADVAGLITVLQQVNESLTAI
jgi:hypothetical protein